MQTLKGRKSNDYWVSLHVLFPCEDGSDAVRYYKLHDYSHLLSFKHGCQYASNLREVKHSSLTVF